MLPLGASHGGFCFFTMGLIPFCDGVLWALALAFDAAASSSGATFVAVGLEITATNRQVLGVAAL